MSWTRLDGAMPSRADITSSFGQELVIHDVDFSDAGRYRCSASNQIGSEPQVKDFHLTVECECLVALLNFRTECSVSLCPFYRRFLSAPFLGFFRNNDVFVLVGHLHCSQGF